MKSVGAGVVLLDSHGGYLDLTPGALEHLVSKESITDHFKVEHTPFARGKFAAVRRAQCLRSGTWYAAKVMRKRRRAQDVRHEILHEAAVLLLARPSSRIVSLHQLYETPSEIILVLELAEGGELQRVIDEEESLCEESVRRYMTNILGALRFLHAHNIAHLDLKPQNLLLMGAHPESEVKLCDFGISRIILSDIEVREVLGTPDYVAPEILQYEPISLATDMWSVGVLAYVLLTGHSPFGGNTKQETFLNISQGQLDFPEDLFGSVSNVAIDFITRLLLVDPGSRLTVEEATQHQWLSNTHTPHPPLPLNTTANTTTITNDTDSSNTSNTTTTSTSYITNNTKASNTTHITTTTTTTSIKSPIKAPRTPPPPPPKPSTPPQAPPPPSSPPPPSPPSLNPISPSGMASYHYINGGGGGASSGVEKENRKKAKPPTPPPPPHHHRYTSTPPPSPQHHRTTTSKLNKENNRNTINKHTTNHTATTTTTTTTSAPAPTTSSPAKPRHRPGNHLEKGRWEGDFGAGGAAKKLPLGKENKEVTGVKLRPSPLTLRRPGSKCEVKSPGEQPKCGTGQAAPVNLILEKGIIC